jgi:hypothetical protein
MYLDRWCSQTELRLSDVQAIERDTLALLDRLDQSGLSVAAVHMAMSFDAIALWIRTAGEDQAAAGERSAPSCLATVADPITGTRQPGYAVAEPVSRFLRHSARVINISDRPWP